MSQVKDLLEDEEGDLLIEKKDLVIGFSDQKHVKDIIVTPLGGYKQFPLSTVAIESYLNSSGKEQEIERDVRIKLTADGYTVRNPRVKLAPDEIIIQPDAERL